MNSTVTKVGPGATLTAKGGGDSTVLTVDHLDLMETVVRGGGGGGGGASPYTKVTAITNLHNHFFLALRLLKEVMKVDMVTLSPTMVAAVVVPGGAGTPGSNSPDPNRGKGGTLCSGSWIHWCERLVFLHLIHITDTMVVVDQVEQVDLEITLLPKFPDKWFDTSISSNQWT